MSVGVVSVSVVSVGVVSVGVNICVIHVQLMVPVLVGERELISNTNG